MMATIIACNPYNPNLGNVPFKCGPDDKKCPDNYECIAYSAEEQLCEKVKDDSILDGGPEGSGLICNDDSAIEPNNTLTQAFPTQVAEQLSSFSLVGAICPNTDRDIFIVKTSASNSTLTASMSYDVDFAPLTLVLKSSQNIELGQGAIQSEDDDNVYVNMSVGSLNPGTYFVEVFSNSTAIEDDNNYELDMNVSSI